MNRFDFTKTETSLEVIIYSRASVFAKTTLAFLALTAFLGLMGFVVKLMRDNSLELINIGIGLTIFIIISLFLGRLFLWNTFGKEILRFQQGSFSRQYDYKLFKSEPESAVFVLLQARRFTGEEQLKEEKDLIDDDLINANWKEGRLDLLLDEASYVSPVNLAKEDLLELIQLINDFNQK